MKLFLLFVGVYLMCAPTWLRPLARLDARDVSSLALAGLIVGSACAELALAGAASPLLTRPIHAHALVKTIGPLPVPGPPLIRVVAGLLAIILPGLGLREWRRSRRELLRLRAAADLGRRQTIGGVDVVTVPMPRVAAYSLGGRDPQIVVSDELVTLLEPAELRAVLDHELAHIRRSHGTVLRFVAALEVALPPLRPTTSRFRLMVERHADEDAIRGDAGRRAALLDALLKVADAQAEPAIAAFGREAGVVERAEALLAAPRRPSRIRRLTDRVALSGATTCGVAVVGGGVLGLRVVLGAVGVCC